eukprot:11100534-Karenia_brevis.AAC.1
MGKGGQGKGYTGKGWYNQSRPWGPYGQVQQPQQGALSGLASQFGNMMGELSALGEMSRIGALISAN